jgi:hypothetical protein
MDEDPRLQHLKTQPYLRGARFQRKPYRLYRPGWDHDHCAACWAKFTVVTGGDEPSLQEGYATCADYVHGAEYDWVCPACFELFRTEMGWLEG